VRLSVPDSPIDEIGKRFLVFQRKLPPCQRLRQAANRKGSERGESEFALSSGFRSFAAERIIEKWGRVAREAGIRAE